MNPARSSYLCADRLPTKENRRMTTTPQQKPFVSGDLWEAAFFAYHGIKPKFELRNDRVLFLFDSSAELFQSLSAFNSSEATVNLARYIDAHKRLKSAMIRFREGQ
jgi:hypothetical protein